MISTVVAACLAVAVLYENDFSTRTSTDLPPGAGWMEYTYDKGGPVAYDYVPSDKFSYYTGPYPWSSSTVPFSQQDGWVKANQGNTQNNRGRSTVSDEDDPALVFSDKDLSTPATNHDIVIYHTLRNVFTNGAVKLQLDIRQPSGWVHSKLYSWFRLMYDRKVMNQSKLGSEFPIELGLSANSLSGGWRAEDQKDGDRTFYSSSKAGNFAAKGFTAQSLHWYRYYVTCDLDTMKSSFVVYDLGTERIDMDSQPAGDPIGQRSDLLFRKNMDASTGGISCLALRCCYINTTAYYGETGYNDGYAYKYDNIKVSWKSPTAENFVECYRNDFSKSKRRVVNGSTALNHTYELTDQVHSMTFTYVDDLLRPCTDCSLTNKPYLTTVYSSGTKLYPAGVDGWRLVGWDGYKGTIVVTTNGSNRVALLTPPAMVMQPMCPDVTNGIVKFEYDARMPKGFNKKSTFVGLSLFGQNVYDNHVNIVNSNSLLRVGVCSSTGEIGGAPSFVTSNGGYLSGDYHKAWTNRITLLNWYRLQTIIDLDKATYRLFVYDLGAASPTTPASFDSSDTNKATFVSDSYPLWSPQVKLDKSIGAYGFTSWNDGSSDRDYAIYFDNVRFWKQNGDDWTLLFQNDFSTTQRKNFTRKALRINPSGYLDRPEHDEDFWTSCPSYNGATYIAGADAVLDSGDNVFSIVQPLGRTIRGGRMTAQYDVRVPNLWTTRMNYFWVQLGGGMLASASTWTYPKYRYQYGRAIRTGLVMGQNGSVGITDGNTGVCNRSAIVAMDGKDVPDGNDTATKATHLSPNANYVGHWIRMKIDADVTAHRWSCTAYDMGTAHPTFATADGKKLTEWTGLRFSTHDPITHLHIIGGRNSSHMPWRDELPGALVVDNIRICHDKTGMVFIVR